MKLWSISTTVRNPERIRNFLKVLQLLEGEPFDNENQKKYQILLIQNKYYRPSNIKSKYMKYYENPELDMTYKDAENIFNNQNYKDPAMRGRQSVNPLNKLGFSIAREKFGNILITELGKKFLSNEYDIGFIFFKALLKLQFPNPWSAYFTEKYGFNVQPLIAAMHVIKKVNENNKVQGLTQTEFSLFIPSLIDYSLIDEYIKKIDEFRKVENKKKYIINFAKEFYKTNKPTQKQINNFFEYGDNIMRYFRLTKYFKITTDKFGGNWIVNLESTRMTEINLILNEFSGKSLKFNSLEEYLNYISDISLPQLPSENINSLKQIVINLTRIIKKYSIDNSIILNKNIEYILSTDISKLSVKELNEHIMKLRDLNIIIRENFNKYILKKDINQIQNIIFNLQDYKTIKKYEPENFEKLVADTLKIINDEIKIQPNYPVDDNGEPISHALGNKPDIECFYASYNAIFEVTLDTSNFQWIRETQPVMRHLREFEKKFNDKKNYCLFISPKIHIDTVYHFWNSIKYGYDNSKQFIIPLTTEQFAQLLDTFLILQKSKRKLSHKDIEELYNKIINEINIVNGHSDWISAIPNIIKKWKTNLIRIEN
jgi:hypothetical protein